MTETICLNSKVEGSKSSQNYFLKKIVVGLLLFFVSTYSFLVIANNSSVNKKQPKIVNIINFVRLLEPRDDNVTENILYQTVEKQIQILREYNLKGTFLLQYDALLDSRYQLLFKSLARDSFEIGVWFEIPKPLVENAGFEWRGRYPWDWQANVGFSTGYLPKERQKLVDVCMNDFRDVFGYYPKSVGCWFIDAYTLNYLYKKYKIVASCNCRDQVGTDGYTLWGGYWSQAYYPSKINSFMPAQHRNKQIQVPIFRMLGSDPIRQYDCSLGAERQEVITLEPVYMHSGGDSSWVQWYFNEFVNGNSMEFSYVQVGQENSFTWDVMSKGFNLQMALIAKLRDDKKLIEETLSKTGQRFKKNYKITPATSVTVKNDIAGSDKKTVWFNSRFYRANLLWEEGTLRFRDIHLFNEKFPSIYTKNKTKSNECSFFTLPFVDGFLWSNPNQIAGLRFFVEINGKYSLLKGKDPVFSDSIPGKFCVFWPIKSLNRKLIIVLDEKHIEIKLTGDDSVKWFLDFTTMDNAKLPFINITSSKIYCQFEKMNYQILVEKGVFSKLVSGGILRVTPNKNILKLNLSKR